MARLGGLKLRMVAASGAVIVMASGLGCAGPMTPFGSALRQMFSKTVSIKEEMPLNQEGAYRLPNDLGPQIRFEPRRQVLHGSAAFAFTIDDPFGVPRDFEVQILYNETDVTSAFLNQAEISWNNPTRHGLRLSSPYMRLLAGRENRVRVLYRRSPEAISFSAVFQPPICSAFDRTDEISTIPGFDVEKEMLRKIASTASQKKLNPYFLAALIAQESGFYPQAVSRAGALGLTQVTHLGEAEVIKTFPDWPRYPGIGDMNLLEMKLGMMMGVINSTNEWRIDPKLSIQGGAEYLSYLMDYWARPDKRALIDTKLGAGSQPLTDVILASYNSGAARVSQALERHGVDWLRDQDLNEARGYVKSVVSYCYHFEDKGK